ncbi:hypothetical protein CF326_g7242 [Tilletia indica]|nr:hypothetical protein CF326_g7242 [Tilletia indica]
MADKEHRARARRDDGDRGARQQQQPPVLASATAAAADPNSTAPFPSTAPAVSPQQPTATPTGTTASSDPTAPFRTTTTPNQNIPTPFSSPTTAAADIAPSSAATTTAMQDPDISRLALRPEHILGGEYITPSVPQQFEAVEIPLTHRLDRFRRAVPAFRSAVREAVTAAADAHMSIWIIETLMEDSKVAPTLSAELTRLYAEWQRRGPQQQQQQQQQQQEPPTEPPASDIVLSLYPPPPGPNPCDPEDVRQWTIKVRKDPLQLVRVAVHSPYRNIRLALFEEALAVLKSRYSATARKGVRAVHEALEGVLGILRQGKVDVVPAGWGRVLDSTWEEIEEECGFHPAAPDGTTCRLCGRWNPTGDADNNTASWRWGATLAGVDTTNPGYKERLYPPNCHTCDHTVWSKLKDEDPERFQKVLNSLGGPKPEPDPTTLRWHNLPLLRPGHTALFPSYWLSTKGWMTAEEWEITLSNEAVARAIMATLFKSGGSTTAGGAGTGTDSGVGPSSSSRGMPSIPSPVHQTRQVTLADVVETEQAGDGDRQLRPPPEKRQRTEKTGKGKSKQVEEEEEEEEGGE